ncbi:hypothetical protein NUU61_003920 [Penicillium alfredii]|uniref:Uncharacterized protein n=1 Tax=Penicillium alfredii TaxID=1506179 RepID=A0A9W9KDF3_9EURO|nr:uncharacterized protein NUU61_003920 [Penicillium alfredii]KAJ5101698.1 hypothetical protein NUU61_003920 [Penicillium alfredii]
MCSLSSTEQPVASRPKLTLQTDSLPRTFGSSTTGLSVSFAAGPSVSPTVRNTFKNAYDVASPSTATNSPSKGPGNRFGNSKPSSPFALTPSTPHTHTPSHPHHNHNHHYHSFHYRPYQIPLGVRSILRNSPLDSATRRRSGSISAGGTAPGGPGARRVFFPAKKQVAYRQPLEEEIRTERYTAQHLDLVHEEEEREHKNTTATATTTLPTAAVASDVSPENDSDSDSGRSLSEETISSSSAETSADEDNKNNPTGRSHRASLSKQERKKRRSLRIERQVRAVALLDGLEPSSLGSATPQTRRQGRTKRRREWKWTLGPLDSGSDRTSRPDGSDALSEPRSSTDLQR